jgi:hypothetical protein
MDTPQFTTVESSNVDAVAYEQDNVFVKFKNGSTYKYKSVPKPVYDNLLTAPSVGQFLNKEIKGIYEFERVL